MKNWVLFVLLVIGCADSGGSTPTTITSTRSFFKVWLPQTGTGRQYNFTSTTTGTSTCGIIYTFSQSESCTCNVELVGATNVGALNILSCSYVMGTGSGVDPGCAGLAPDLKYYTNTNSVLNVCDNSSCVAYQQCVGATCATL